MKITKAIIYSDVTPSETYELDGYDMTADAHTGIIRATCNENYTPTILGRILEIAGGDKENINIKFGILHENVFYGSCELETYEFTVDMNKLEENVKITFITRETINA